MPTMIVLVRLKEGVEPSDYERWVLESYAPAVKELPSVSGWRNHRVTGLLGSGESAPYEYVVTLEIGDLAGLGEDMAGGADAGAALRAARIRRGDAVDGGAFRLRGAMRSGRGGYGAG